MSWIRMEPQEGSYQGKRQYDAICQTQEELAAAVDNGYAEYNGSKIQMAVGSLCFCLETQTVWALTSLGWTEVT